MIYQNDMDKRFSWLYCWQWLCCAILAGLGRQTQVHGVGDGATWITNQMEEQFGVQGTYLLDFYHVCEYLAAAANACSDNVPETGWLSRNKVNGFRRTGCMQGCRILSDQFLPRLRRAEWSQGHVIPQPEWYRDPHAVQSAKRFQNFWCHDVPLADSPDIFALMNKFNRGLQE